VYVKCRYWAYLRTFHMFAILWSKGWREWATVIYIRNSPFHIYFRHSSFRHWPFTSSSYDAHVRRTHKLWGRSLCVTIGNQVSLIYKPYLLSKDNKISICGSNIDNNYQSSKNQDTAYECGRILHMYLHQNCS
jgi:hypothetical protein